MKDKEDIPEFMKNPMWYHDSRELNHNKIIRDWKKSQKKPSFIKRVIDKILGKSK